MDEVTPRVHMIDAQCHDFIDKIILHCKMQIPLEMFFYFEVYKIKPT
jgi:hypothetical protein